MKIRKTLTIGGKDIAIVDDDVRLDLSMTGRANFRVQASAPVEGIVTFSLGYADKPTDTLFFTGYVENSFTVDASTQRIMCRELVSAMQYPFPVSLRHPTLQDVLATYTKSTGLEFVVPDQPYVKERVPCFQTLGNGYHALDMLGDVFSVPYYIWQPQGDGKVFVGSWKHSRWAKIPVELEEEYFTNITVAGTKTMPAVPSMRPGVKLNGDYVTSLQLTGHEMVITCEKSLNV